MPAASLFDTPELQSLLRRPAAGLVPTRLLLINYWLYHQQVFHFAQGRLFLTGHNGSGKSTGLTAAITMLLDGDSSPARLDPFGGTRRTLRYYLLGDADAGFSFEARRAYLALEFVSPEGEYQTIGLGLSASEGSREIRKWGFWLPGQIQSSQNEDGLALVVDGQTLTERTLKERIGDGEVASGQGEYAELVRRHIFQGVEQRAYQDTLDLLLTVRGSKLGREVRPSQMEELLRRSLPPIAPEVMTQLGEGIERLDRHALRLKALEEQVEAARAIAAANFTALLSQARLASAHDVQAAQRAERQRRALDETRQQRAELRGQLEQESARDAELIVSTETIQTEVNALALQVEDQDGALARLERDLGEARASLERGRSSLRRERERLERAEQRQTEIAALEVQDQANLAEVEAALSARWWWAESGLAGSGLAERTRLLDAAETALRQYERDTERLTERAQEAERAAERASQAQQTLEELTTELEALLTGSAAELAAQAAELGWQGETLPPAALEAYQQALETRLEVSEAWPELEEGAAYFQTLARQAVNAARDEWRGVQAQWEAVQLELHHLGQQLDIDPLLPDDRAAALAVLSAAGIIAAPLYTAVRPHENAPELNNLEAALLLSGVLTALIVPQGQQQHALKLLAERGLSEALLVPAQAVQPNLGEVLTPEETLNAELLDGVQAALSGIGLGTSENEAQTAVSLDGSWRSGVLSGRASAQASRFLGRTARAQERQRQLERLAAQEADLGEQVALLSGAFDDLSAAEQSLIRQLGLLRDAPEQMPPRREQHSRRERAREALAGRAQAQETAISALQLAQQRASGARQVLQLAFAPLKLDTSETDLPFMLDAARQDAREAERQQSEAQTIHSRLLQHRKDADDAQERASDSRSELERLEAERIPQEAQRDSLQATVTELRGQQNAPDAAELRRRLRTQRSLLSDLNRERSTLARSLAAGQGRLSVAAQRLPELEHSSLEADAARAQTAVRLSEVLARHPQLAEHLAEQLGEASAANLAANLAGLEAERTRSESVLRDQYELRRFALETPDSYRPSFSERGPRFVLDGQLIGPDDLLSHLAAELDAAQKLLTEEEARVFHNELIRLLAEELDRKQRDAQSWVSSVRRTLAGLRFHEERLDLERHTRPPSGLPGEALAALIDGRTDPVHQPEAWWAQVQTGVRDLVRELQASPGSEVSFAQSLERALDYREWLMFRFVSVLPGVDGASPRRREITDRTFAQRSGGERSAVLYTFLFAALGARFDLLGPGVPRLIGLDEAFAGMDLPNISALYGVLTDLELSWIATSERRIDLSRALPAAATYQLFRVASRGGDGVSSLSYLWDGQTQHDGRLAGIAGE